MKRPLIVAVISHKIKFTIDPLRLYIAAAGGDTNKQSVITTNISSKNNKLLFDNMCQFKVHKYIIGVSWLES